MARVLCAMSGGVDSSVSAHLLKEAGHEVIGVFLRLGAAPSRAGQGLRTSHRGCCSVEDSHDAARVAARLGIPFYALDAEGEFGRIIDYFVEEYHQGRTPNPCARCNQWLKFGTLREKALALGCDTIATGHYARLDAGPDGEPRLLRGLDRAKDQSYFLFPVAREALAMTLFPVGGLRKEEVRALAHRAGLPVAEKPDSQEICFVPGDYREVLEARAPGRIREGNFVDTAGRALGKHTGHQHFTVGQRRGLGKSFGEPRYVVSIEPIENLVVLGSREETLHASAIVEEVGWSSIDRPAPGATLEAEVQIRHRHRAQPASLRIAAAPGGGKGSRVEVEFLEPVEAVTPGQAAVFYRGEVLLGGGWIASSNPASRR